MKRGIWLGCLAFAFAASATWAADLKVLILIGDARSTEPPVLKAMTKVGAHNFTIVTYSFSKQCARLPL